MDNMKRVVLENSAREARMVTEEYHGKLYDGDSIVVPNGQEAVFLHDDGRIAAIYKTGTFTFRSGDKWDHKGRLFYVDYTVNTISDWYVRLYIAAERKQLEVWGRVKYCVSDTGLLIESMAKRRVFAFTVFEAEKRLVKIILENALPSIVINNLAKPGCQKSNSNKEQPDKTLAKEECDELKSGIMPQLSMYFASNGLLLSDLTICRALESDSVNEENECIEIDEGSACIYVDGTFSKRGAGSSDSHEAGKWNNVAGSWSNSGWYNSVSWADSAWANSAWANSGDSASCRNRSADYGRTKPDPVSETEALFRAAVPNGIARGETFPLVIAMFTQDYEKDAETIIRSVSGDRTEAQAGLFEVSSGSQISIQLFSKDITIEDDLCIQKWNGMLSTFHFMLELPENYRKKTVGIQCRVYVDDVHLTDLSIVARVEDAYQELIVEMRKILTAFASYSSKDRAIVAARLQGMLAATKDKMDIFFDVESLHTGEDWENRIRSEIQSRAIFYLFWSRNARMSEWVQKELSIALEIKELQDIEPIPLEAPDVCPPPESLNRKHFFNRMLNYTNRPVVVEYDGEVSDKE